MTTTLEATPNEPSTDSPALAAQGESFLESLASICCILAVGLFVMTFVFQNFEIPSGSMIGTLLIGDHVLVDRVTLAPSARWASFMDYREVHRGDVIVFLKPGEPDLFLVKRAIAIPGDHIHLRNGTVYLNGVAQNEPYAAKPTDDNADPYRDNFPALPASTYEGATVQWASDLPQHIQNGDLVVPPGKVFALGDNRTNSLDSRYWGFVPREDIIGRPLFAYWSFETPDDQIDKQSIGERLTFLSHVLFHIVDQTRWKRTLHVIR